MERWKTCYQYDDYEVSNLGRVRNKWDYYILKPHTNKNGLDQVILRKNTIRHCEYVHKLVAEAFVPGGRDDLIVIHNDGDKSNNYADNLRWISKREYFGDLYSQDGYNNDHFKKRVRCVETGEIFGSIGEASDAMGIGYKTISRCVSNPYTKTREGYHFEQVT